MSRQAVDRERIHFIVATHPDTKSERLLKNSLSRLSDEELAETLNQLDAVTPHQARDWALQNFDRLDSSPNPPDGYISRDEIGEFVFLASTLLERAILLFLWLHFDEIRTAHPDFSGAEEAFDYVITKNDLHVYAGHRAAT